METSEEFSRSRQRAALKSAVRGLNRKERRAMQKEIVRELRRATWRMKHRDERIKREAANNIPETNIQPEVP